MAYSIKWRPKALDELRKLPKVVSKRIVRKVSNSKENPRKFLEKLSGQPSYKIRAGDYRAIIDIDEQEKIIIVRIIGHRRNIYKRHLP